MNHRDWRFFVAGFAAASAFVCILVSLNNSHPDSTPCTFEIGEGVIASQIDSRAFHFEITKENSK